MRRIKIALSQPGVDGWMAAVRLTEAYLSGSEKADRLLDLLPDSFLGKRRAVCQSLFLGALRHGHRVRQALRPLCRNRPRPMAEAVCLVAGYELWTADPGKQPKIVHHAVERAKTMLHRGETRFLNAVLRQLPPALAAIEAGEDAAATHSHPVWLVERWRRALGPDRTERLLAWNQVEPDTFVRVYDPELGLPQCLEPSQWDGFYRLQAVDGWQAALRPLLDSGRAYIKDPSTRLAAALLDPAPGAPVLDLCAAPGGKARDLADRLNYRGTIVAVDLPGQRLQRLRDNLATFSSEALRCPIFEADVAALEPGHLAEAGLPDRFDAVLLDAPCSNTGVIRRRPDVKWRLHPEAIESCATLQRELLSAAAGCVKPGGRLVYSTCSIEPEENTDVIETFLSSRAGAAFSRLESSVAYPWETGHDGAGLCLLQRLA